MTSQIGSWPQVGDDALVAVPSGRYGDFGQTASLKRAKVTRIGKRDVTLDVGIRFRLDKVTAGEVWLRSRNDVWGVGTYVLHPDHERAAGYRMHNELSRMAGQVGRLAEQLVQAVRSDRFGATIDPAVVEDLSREVQALTARRVSYGLQPAGPAADGPPDQQQHSQEDEEPQQRVDGEAEDGGRGDDESGQEDVD